MQTNLQRVTKKNKPPIRVVYFFMHAEIRKIKCNADKRCPLRLDAAEPLSTAQPGMQTKLQRVTKKHPGNDCFRGVFRTFLFFFFDLLTIC